MYVFSKKKRKGSIFLRRCWNWWTWKKKKLFCNERPKFIFNVWRIGVVKEDKQAQPGFVLEIIDLQPMKSKHVYISAWSWPVLVAHQLFIKNKRLQKCCILVTIYHFVAISLITKTKMGRRSSGGKSLLYLPRFFRSIISIRSYAFGWRRTCSVFFFNLDLLITELGFLIRWYMCWFR